MTNLAAALESMLLSFFCKARMRADASCSNNNKDEETTSRCLASTQLRLDFHTTRNRVNSFSASRAARPSLTYFSSCVPAHHFHVHVSVTPVPHAFSPLSSPLLFRSLSPSETLCIFTFRDAIATTGSNRCQSIKLRRVEFLDRTEKKLKERSTVFCTAREKRNSAILITKVRSISWAPPSTSQ